MRLAQLYAFWLLAEILIRIPFAAFIYALYLYQTATGAPQTTPGFEQLTLYVRDWTTPVLVACAWFALARHARFRHSWLAMLLGAIITLANLQMAHQMLLGPDGVLKGMIAHNPPRGDAITLSMQAAFLGWALFHIQFIYIIFRGQLRLRGLGAARRREMSEFAPDAGWLWPTTAFLLYLPPVLRFARRRAATAILLVFAGVANVINYWITVMTFLFICMGVALFIALNQPGQTFWTLAALIIGFAMVLSGAVFMQWVVHITSRIARRFMRRSLEEAQALDTRAPVLFLRSFLDDQVALNARRFRLEQWLFDAASRRTNLDHIVMTEGSALGPTVALGDPSDRTPPYGAARGYFDHSDWQDAVARLCDDSRAIIMTLDGTEGVAWEVEHLRTRRHAAKTLYLLRPDDIGTEEGAALITKVIGTAPASDEPVFGLEIDAAGAPTLLTAAAPTAYLYQVAVRSFLRRVSCSGAA